ncbi:hypothetical protein DLAC_06286 [Tieghemostelium lacteum]|uniref:MACPF domain-containing protein n=1 Tax=Tieghemostelium lacteum TaxID=361077 RepID=A0A151ZED9_TIELA|nr:hypothetical protein DLAC_06286 [Tieghemostelium lacteum]|eukprot:KYQ92323.1 hypothetical protein DLAC_06286 [Tieghemostelium lacteum]
MKNFLILSLCLSIVFDLAIATSTKKYYVDSKSSCTSNCGSSSSPYKTLLDPIKVINSLSFNECYYNTPELYIKPGNYSGINNRELTITNPINIKSWGGNSSNTFIDCQGFGYGLKAIKSIQIIINGLTILNCNSNYGAGIYISQTPGSLSDVRLSGNQASSGGALYIRSSTVTINNCTFEKNNALEEGGGAVFENSRITISKSKATCNTLRSTIVSDFLLLDSTIKSDTHNSSSQVSCIDSKFSLSNGTNICGYKGAACLGSNPNGTNPNTPSGPICPASSGTCGDNICDFQKESCLNCPSDCNTCTFSGSKLTSYKGCHPLSLNSSCLVSSVVLTTPVISNFLSSECLVSGVIENYFSVDRDGLYSFKVIGTNIGVKLSINGKVLINAFFIQEKIDSAQDVILISQKVNRFKVEFFGNGPAVRSLSILKKPYYDTVYSLFEQSFYSLNVCGDNILDKNETCQNDFLADNLAETPIFCGDGICNEDTSDCILDCGLHITETCSATEVVDNHFPTGFTTGIDTLGLLIDNQQLWHLPGVEKFTMGVNVLTGESTLSPLFYFGYCGSKGSNLVQDLYRSTVYVLPEEIAAVPYPRCTFDLSSSFHATSFSMANEQATKNSYKVDAKVEFGIGSVSGGANAAYQEETSVKTARELESRRSGSISSTESKCLTSKVELVKNTFHPVFMQDIGSVNNETEMYEYLLKYGTYYYKTAIMGGKLTQVSVVDSSFESSSTSSEMEQHTKLSFGASVKAPMFNAKFDYAQSDDYQVSFSSQKEYESKSSRSTLITYGGAPASFNPSGDSVSDYESWAQTVDLYPVPIDYKLDRIYNIIPKDWKSKNGSAYIHDLWNKAEELLNYNLGVQTRNSKYTVNIYHNNKRTSTTNQNSIVQLGNSPSSILTSVVHGFYVYESWVACETCEYGHEDFDCCNSDLIGSLYKYDVILPQMDNVNTITLKLENDGATTGIHNIIGTNMVSVLNWGNGRLHLFEINKNTVQSTNTQVFYKDYILVSFLATCLHGYDEGQLRGRVVKDEIEDNGENFPGDFMYGDWEKMEIIFYGNLGSFQHVVEMNDQVFPDIDKESRNILLKVPKQQNIGRITKITMRCGNNEYWGRDTYPRMKFSTIWVSQTYCGYYQQCTPADNDPFNFITITNEEWEFSRSTTSKENIRLYGLRDL